MHPSQTSLSLPSGSTPCLVGCSFGLLQGAGSTRGQPSCSGGERSTQTTQPPLQPRTSWRWLQQQTQGQPHCRGGMHCKPATRQPSLWRMQRGGGTALPTGCATLSRQHSFRFDADANTCFLDNLVRFIDNRTFTRTGKCSKRASALRTRWNAFKVTAQLQADCHHLKASLASGRLQERACRHQVHAAQAGICRGNRQSGVASKQTFARRRLRWLKPTAKSTLHAPSKSKRAQLSC